ncbi:MAG: SGNH/GDSL hydrolase family protein [Suilimivivens sp.]
MDLQKIMKPVWLGGTVYSEACTFAEDDGVCKARLLYIPVSGSIRMESYDGMNFFEEGKDYRVQEDYIILTENSRISHACESDLILKDREAAQEELVQIGVDLGFGPVETLDGHFITLRGINHPEYITRWTVLVTYRTQEAGLEMRPDDMLSFLPCWQQKMQERRNCHIVLYGDSISYGCDCSGLYHQAPDQPIWAELVRQWLELTYHNKVTLDNISMPSADTVWAADHCAERMKENWNPDLVILGYGMNDRCHGDEYGNRTQSLIEEVYKKYPNAELLLIATTLPNQLVSTPPVYFCAYQTEFQKVLQGMCRPGIAVADVQGMQKQLMKKKSYLDLTGNFLNHPNDYLARVQAQTVAMALGGYCHTMQ